MKSKRLFAAMLCAVTLLTGCSEASESSSGTNSEQSSSVSVPSYSGENSSSTESTTFSSSVATSSSSSKPISSSSKAEKKIYAELYFHGRNEDTDRYYYAFKLKDKNGEELPTDNCTVNCYVSDTPNDIGELFRELVVPPENWFPICVEQWETKKYCYIQVVGKDYTSELSNRCEVPAKVQKVEIPRYTHTFTAPSYLTVIPDYSEALEEIEQGVEPDSFSVSVQFTCPGCGNKQTYRVWLVEFPYSRDGKMPFNAKCGMTNCVYGKKEFCTTIESHAVRIS